MLLGELLGAVVTLTAFTLCCHFRHSEPLEARHGGERGRRASLATHGHQWCEQGQLHVVSVCQPRWSVGSGFISQGQPLFICACQGHSLFKCCWLLQLHVRLQGVVEACGEDFNLMILREPLAVVDKRQEVGLVICDCCLTPELNELAQGVPADRQSEMLVHQLLEFVLCWHALVLLKQREPLRRVAHHVEGCWEHLLGILGVLDPKELVAPIDPE
jgi:hypothetical protein